MYTGFKNAATATLTVNLMATDGSDTHKGTGDWYGEITLSNIELYWVATDAAPVLTDGVPGYSARIVGMGGALAIGVYSAPTVGHDFVAALEATADSVLEAEASAVGTYYTGPGTYVSYTLSEMLMVGLDVISAFDWTANTANAYAFDLSAQVKVAGLTIDAGAAYGFGYALAPIQFGVQVAGAIPPIAFTLGFDGTTDPAFAYSVGASATMTLANTDTIALGVVYGDAFNGLDIKFAFTEALASGFVDKLEAALTVWLLDIIAPVDPMEYEIIFTAGYDTGKLYPHFGVTFGDDTNGTANGQILTAFVHVNYDLFEAAPTVLFVEWNSGNLLTPVIGVLTIGVTVTY